jgi:hypothetical protein
MSVCPTASHSSTPDGTGIIQTALDVFAHRLAVDSNPTRDRRHAQPLPMKIQDHGELPRKHAA